MTGRILETRVALAHTLLRVEEVLYFHRISKRSIPNSFADVSFFIPSGEIRFAPTDEEGV